MTIAIENLKFAYPGGSHVLAIDSLKVEKGQHTFLHGPSGSGKTTLLGLIAGILTPSTGTIKILGQSIGDLSASGRDHFRGEHIGYIFQMFNLIPYLSVQENIVLPCLTNKKRAARIREATPGKSAERLAQHLQIGEFLDRAVTELSVGQQQRVAAARSLIGCPELIIADEPTSALDTARRHDFIELLFQEAESAGATVLFVSHDETLRPLFKRDLSLAEINRP